MTSLVSDIQTHADIRRAPTAPKQPDLKWTLPGFGAMTRVSTTFGEVHAAALRERDLVRLPSGNGRAISWVDRIRLDEAFMKRCPDASPVVIRAGSLGGGLPKGDVIVSPEQEIGLGRHGADIRFERAGNLVGRPGIMRKPEDMMTYTMFHCDQPVVVRVEGIWARVDP